MSQTAILETTEELTRSYLSFRLEDEKFAIPVGKVIEILEVPKITKVPRAPDYMKGVVNLRGSVLPVIDTHLKFGLPPTKLTVDTCIAVLDIEIDGEKIMLGALVDAVEEVLEINPEQISPSPSIGNKYKSEFIDGMAKVDEEFIMILSIDKVFSSDELITLKSVAEEKQPEEKKKKKKKKKKEAIKSNTN